MNVLDAKITRKVQLKALEALKEFDRICQKNSLQYFLIGGSALGAYRHGGFIPWDDDIDIGMLRKDYDKFLAICEEQLDKKYFLQTPLKEAHFVFPFTKIRINDTLYKESIVAHIDIHHGVFIDIFPLDNIPNHQWKKLAQKYMLNLLNHIRVYKILQHERFSFKNIFKWYPSKLLNRQYNSVLTMEKSDFSIKIGNLPSSYPYGIEIHSKTMFGNGRKMLFEDLTILVPEKIEDYLTQMYGANFLELPPIEKRVTHKPSEVSGV